MGGGRGTVSRWDSGAFTGEATNDDLILLDLHGGRLRGQATLRRAASAEWSFLLQ